MPCLMPVGSRSRARRLRGQEPTYLFKDEVPVLVGVEALQVVMQRVAHLLQGHQNRCMSEASHMMPPRSCSSAWLCNMAGHLTVCMAPSRQRQKPLASRRFCSLRYLGILLLHKLRKCCWV